MYIFRYEVVVFEVLMFVSVQKYTVALKHSYTVHFNIQSLCLL